MELPKYLIANDPNTPDGGYWVIRTERPFMTGSVVMVHSFNQDLIDTMNFQMVNGKRVAKCKEYYIYIIPQYAPYNADVTDEQATEILSEMAEYFKEAKIDRRRGQFRVYHENPQPLPTKETRHFYAEKKRAYQLRKAKELIAKSRQYERVDPDDNF